MICSQTSAWLLLHCHQQPGAWKEKAILVGRSWVWVDILLRDLASARVGIASDAAGHFEAEVEEAILRGAGGRNRTGRGRAGSPTALSQITSSLPHLTLFRSISWETDLFLFSLSISVLPVWKCQLPCESLPSAYSQSQNRTFSR